MKSFGRLFSRSKKSHRCRRVPGPDKRRLRSELLERRELLAGDLLAFHNDFAPVDVDHNFRLEPYDALLIINHLNRHGVGSVDAMTAAGESGLTAGFMDVDGDETVAPYDALQVINALNRGQGIDGELIELRLDVRDHQTDASLLDPDSRTLTLGIDDATGRTPIVDLEVSYLDLRTFGDQAGAAAVLVDLFTPHTGVSFSDIVEPVVTETQNLLFSESLQQASGDLLFSLEPVAGFPSDATVVTVPVSTFEDNSQAAIEQILREFGFEDSEFSVEVANVRRELAHQSSFPVGMYVRIRFLGDHLANRQMPNIAVDTSQLGGDEVLFRNHETAAIHSDGSVNSEAIRWNIDLRSRSAGNREVYLSDPVGQFLADGFNNVGASVNPLLLLYEDHENTISYDAFSLPVRFKRPVTNFIVQVDQPLDPPLKYHPKMILIRQESKDLAAQNVLVDIDDDPSIAGDDRFGLVVFNIVENLLVIGADDPRTTTSNVALPISISELLSNDSSGPGNGAQTLGVSAVTLATAQGGTAVLDGDTIRYTPPANFEGTDTLTYTVSDDGEPVASSTATLTIHVNNINPTAGIDNVATFFNVPAIVTASQLLSNDSAGEANQSLTIVAANATAGTQGTVSLQDDGSLRFVPASGFTGSTTFEYTVSDGIETTTGTVTADVQEFQPSTISGSVFFDSIASIDDPVRNGIREVGEQGLAGITVTITSAAANNVTGSSIVRTQTTTLTGEFRFGLLAPGTYTVSVDLPSDVIDGVDTAGTLGDVDSVANQFTVEIAQPGGVNATNYDFSLIGYSGTAAAAAMKDAQILASTYLNHSLDVASNSAGGVQGGTASLNPDGTLNFLTIGAGFDGVQHAEIVLNEDQHSALLTIIDGAHQVLTARLEETQFLVVSDGRGGVAVRFFGGLEDFDFALTPESTVRQEFDNFRNAIDQILASGEF